MNDFTELREVLTEPPDSGERLQESAADWVSAGGQVVGAAATVGTLGVAFWQNRQAEARREAEMEALRTEMEAETRMLRAEMEAELRDLRTQGFGFGVDDDPYDDLTLD